MNRTEDDLEGTPESAAAARRARAADFRTHLANERTFLAWCRTSIALVVLGFVAERLDLLLRVPGAERPASPADSPDLYLVSLFSFILAGVIIAVSGWRFLSVRRMIRRGEISVSVFPEALVIISMAAIIVMVIILLIK